MSRCLSGQHIYGECDCPAPSNPTKLTDAERELKIDAMIDHFETTHGKERAIYRNEIRALLLRASQHSEAPPTPLTEEHLEALRHVIEDAETYADVDSVESVQRLREIRDFLAEITTRVPARNTNDDCHLVLTADVVRLRKMAEDALAAAPTERTTDQ